MTARVSSKKHLSQFYSLGLSYLAVYGYDKTMVQIFGTPKCKETKKAERYCKERSLAYQFRDLLEKGISPRELDELLQQWDLDQIIDSSSQFYKNQGYQYLDFNGRDEILDHPQLCKTPLLRFNNKWIVGFDLDQVKAFLDPSTRTT